MNKKPTCMQNAWFKTEIFSQKIVWSSLFNVVYWKSHIDSIMWVSLDPQNWFEPSKDTIRMKLYQKNSKNHIFVRETGRLELGHHFSGTNATQYYLEFPCSTTDVGMPWNGALALPFLHENYRKPLCITISIGESKIGSPTLALLPENSRELL